MLVRLQPSIFSLSTRCHFVPCTVLSSCSMIDEGLSTSMSLRIRRPSRAARQVIEAFPDDTSPRYLLGDRDSIYGAEFRSRVKGMQIEEVVTAPHSPF